MAHPGQVLVPRMILVPSRLAVLALVGTLLAAPAVADSVTGRNAGTMPDGWLSPSRPATLAELRARLDDSDRMAALEALHDALSGIGDGAIYVWRRQNRQLTGAIRPTMAFRDSSGRVCRHVIYVLTLGSYAKSIEGIACRAEGGRWRLSG